MIPLIMPIGALLAGVALLLLGSGLLNTLLALKSELEGYSGAMLGLIMSGYFAGFFVGTAIALPLIKRVGHIRAFACCGALVAVTVLLHVLVVHPWAWVLIRVLTGAALVILYTTIESWLNGQTPSDQRGRVFAIYMTVNLGALALAQQLLRFDSSLSHLLFVLSALLICLSLVPVTCTRMQQPHIQDAVRIPLRQLARTAPVAIAGALMSGLVMGAFWGLGASYAARIGLGVDQVATFISCAIIGGALLQFPLGRYSDSRDRRKVLGMVSLGAAVITLLLLLLSDVEPLTFPLIALFGGFAFALYPLAVAHLVDHLEPHDILAGGSAMLLIHGVGAMFGPLLGGQALYLLGDGGLPLYWTLMLVVLGGFALFNQRGIAADEPDHHTADFVPMVRTSPTALEMLPGDEATPDAGGTHS